MRLALLAAVALAASPAAARVIGAGPGKEFDRPSLAIAAAETGDTVLIEPGSYFDCATWTANGITLAGRAPGVVLTDTVCQGKAVMVLRGENAVVRDLTLARARVGEGNGAGVRLEAASATFERVRFSNNQAGLLGGSSGGRIVLRGCTFEGGGVTGEQPTFALNVGPAAELEVTGTTFAKTAGGQIRSAAGQTRLVASAITASAPGAAVETSGTLILEDNTLHLSGDATAGARATGTAVLRRNRLVNSTGQPMTLLLDWGRGSPVLDNNMLLPSDTEVSTAGAWRHEASGLYHGTKDSARRAAGMAKRGLQELLR